MAAQFIEFEEAKNILNVQDRELHAMVARGELRAFRDQGLLKFRREDLEKLRSSRSSAQAPVQPAPVLDFDRTAPAEEAPTIPAIELGGEERPSEEAIEAITPEVQTPKEDQTQTVELTLEEDQTAGLELEGEESPTETVVLETEEGTAGVETVAQPIARPTAARRYQAAEIAEETVPADPLLTALLLAAMFVLLIGGLAISGGVLGTLPQEVINLFTRIIKPPVL